MASRNSIAIPENWTFWHVLGALAGASIVIAAAVATYISDNFELQISKVDQKVEQLAPTSNKSVERLDEFALKINSIESKLTTIDQTAILTGERLREIEAIEQKLAGINATMAAHDERLKALSTLAQDLNKSVVEVDKKIVGTENQSENVQDKVSEVSTEMKTISTGLNTNNNKLGQVVAAIKLGFAQNAEVQPLLDLLALNEAEDPNVIIETLGKIKSDYQNDPEKITDQVVSRFGVSVEDARVLADVRLSQNRPEAFFKAPKFAAAKPESAQGATSGSQLQAERHPLESVDLEVNGSGESIFSLCKKYINLVSANSCFDYFLEQLPAAEQ